MIDCLAIYIYIYILLSEFNFKPIAYAGPNPLLGLV